MFLEESGHEAAAARMRASSESLQEAMEPVFGRVQHVDPISANAPDPEGFEHDLVVLCGAVRAHLADERQELAQIEPELSPVDSDDLTARLDSKRRDAVPNPHPGRNPIVRLVRRAAGKMERDFPDSSQQHRPGRDKLAE